MSTKASVGVSEVMLVQGAIHLTLKLSELEARLGHGETLLEAMTPPPPGDAVPASSAKAARDSASLQSVLLSGRPLRVRRVGRRGGALAQRPLPSQDALILADLLHHHRALAALDVSHCRLTSAISLELVRALGASLRRDEAARADAALPRGQPAADVGRARAHRRARRDAVPLAELDLSSTELCGGTVALPRVFGELRASTAKVGDEGHSATLTSDGLCSVGPLMERGSGSYHAELLVKQATDADGAYVGIVTPLAKLSSYPGADAHSVGWRAKGGLRHKHGSTIEAASLAWGQGDRVGLRLDTDQCSLTLYKNGEALTTNQLLPVSFGEAGARFCIGRYYGTVEMYCLSMSRIGGSQSIDFTALAALCSRIAPLRTLRTLRLSQNQIAGIDAVGGGERKEAGVRELIDALSAEGCSLDELDLSGNRLTDEDASALLRAAMRPSHAADGILPSPDARDVCSVAQLRVHEWRVPIAQLKRAARRSRSRRRRSAPPTRSCSRSRCANTRSRPSRSTSATTPCAPASPPSSAPSSSARRSRPRRPRSPLAARARRRRPALGGRGEPLQLLRKLPPQGARPQPHVRGADPRRERWRRR